MDRTWRKPCWVSIRISLNAECLKTEDYVLHNLADNAGEGDRSVVWHTIFVTQLMNWQDVSPFSLGLYCVSVITLMAKEQSRKLFAPSVELAANGALTMEDVWDVIKQTCTCKKACSGILNSLKTIHDWLWDASKETVAEVYCRCYQGMGKIISSCTSWKQDAGSVVCRLTNKTCVWPRLLLCRKWHQDVLSCFVTWGFAASSANWNTNTSNCISHVGRKYKEISSLFFNQFEEVVFHPATYFLKSTT